MRELSHVEVNAVSGGADTDGNIGDFIGGAIRGIFGGIFGGMVNSVTKGAESILGSISHAASSVGKIFTDGVFNIARGFWEGRYTK